MKIIFMGTPDFAKESLEALYNNKHQIDLVITNPDRAKGRGMKIICSPVKEFAMQKEIKIEQPEKIKNNNELIDKLRKIEPDVICVVAYGKILPKEILEIPKYGCINVHASLLPKYRGAAPIQWAILNGDEKTGVTTMYMDIGMDTGDIILKEEVTIGENETTGELWERLSKIGAKLLVKTLEEIEQNKAPRVKQDENFSIAPMLSKDIAKIDWNNQTSVQIKNLIRGLNPIMGAYTNLGIKKIKFWKAEIVNENELNIKENIEPGTIVLEDSNKGLYIKTIDGVISILEIQGENAKKMNIKDFLRGNRIMEKKFL